MQRSALPALLASAALLLSACAGGGDGAAPEQDGTSASSPGRPGSGSDSPPSGRDAPPAKGSVKVLDTVAEDLKSPWGLARLPEGDLLVSSRDEGTITRVGAKTGKKTEVGAVPGVAPGGEGGLMGLALSPSYAQDKLVYAYFTTASDNRIVRFLYDPEKPEGEQLGAPDTVLKGIPKGSNHDGGVIAFGPDKQLYAGTGETGDEQLAQDKKSLGGKILRMTPDGDPAEGNPEPDSVIYSYGHRNVQGLAWDAEKRLWASEFGQDTWDELNLIRPGENYGWPEVEGKSEDGGEQGFVDPVAVWHTAEASPSGIAYAKGSIWMAALRGQRLWRIPLDGTKPVAEPEHFLEGEYGRLRTVVPADGDELLVVTNETDTRGTPESGDDKILRVRVS